LPKFPFVQFLSVTKLCSQFLEANLIGSSGRGGDYDNDDSDDDNNSDDRAGCDMVPNLQVKLNTNITFLDFLKANNGCPSSL
jgi:hypothetical protein